MKDEFQADRSAGATRHAMASGRIVEELRGCADVPAAALERFRRSTGEMGAEIRLKTGLHASRLKNRAISSAPASAAPSAAAGRRSVSWEHTSG